MVSSARVSANNGEQPISDEEADLLQRSIRKVQLQDESKVTDINKASHANSYKDKLLNLFGEDIHTKLNNSIMEEHKVWLEQKQPLQYIDDGPVIPLTDPEWKNWSNPWQKTLFVNTLGKKINFKVIENSLRKRWTKKGSINFVDMADGYYVVHFEEEEDYNRALFEGPWRVAYHYLIVQRWRPLFFQNMEISPRVVVWIRIPKLPLELYNAQFLWRIGSALGNMLKIDQITSIHSRGKYARICVEIDLDKPLAPHIIIRGFKLPIEYEGLHMICFSCGKYGHKTNLFSDLLNAKKQIETQRNMETMESQDLIYRSFRNHD
jgi:hypothetical protein